MVPDAHDIAPDAYAIEPDVYDIAPDAYDIALDAYAMKPDEDDMVPDAYAIKLDEDDMVPDAYDAVPDEDELNLAIGRFRYTAEERGDLLRRLYGWERIVNEGIITKHAKAKNDYESIHLYCFRVY